MGAGSAKPERVARNERPSSQEDGEGSVAAHQAEAAGRRIGVEEELDGQVRGAAVVVDLDDDLALVLGISTSCRPSAKPVSTMPRAVLRLHRETFDGSGSSSGAGGSQPSSASSVDSS